MEDGWVSINRSILNHYLWEEERFSKAQAWIDLILNARYSDKKISIKGNIIVVKRGQQIRSQITLSKTWKWDRKTVKRFLTLLKKDGMIVENCTHLTTVITICNYDSFQSINECMPQQKGQVSGQACPSSRDTNNKETKKTKDQEKESTKERNDFFELKPNDVNKDLWIEFMQERKKRKATISLRATKAIVKKIKEFKKIGKTNEEAIIIYLESSWKGLDVDWTKPNQGVNYARTEPTEAEWNSTNF